MVFSVVNEILVLHYGKTVLKDILKSSLLSVSCKQTHSLMLEDGTFYQTQRFLLNVVYCFLI